MVSMEVALSPCMVSEPGASEQVGARAGVGDTEHVRLTGPVNSCWAANVMVAVAELPAEIVAGERVEGALTEKFETVSVIAETGVVISPDVAIIWIGYCPATTSVSTLTVSVETEPALVGFRVSGLNEQANPALSAVEHFSETG